MNESIAQQLREARQDRHLSLLQIAQATHIRQHYLRALEAGDLEGLQALSPVLLHALDLVAGNTEHTTTTSTP